MAEISATQSSYAKMQQLSKIRLFDALRVYPDGVAYDGQDAGDTILLFLRQHPIVLIPSFLRSVGILLLAALFGYMTTVFQTGLNSVFALQTEILLLGFAIALTNIIYEFAKWYYTITIITSTSVIDLDFQSIMNSKWSSTVLRAIQDVSYNAPGFVNALFDMANLTVLTAAHKENFQLNNIPKARDVQDVLMDLIENEKRNAPAS